MKNPLKSDTSEASRPAHVPARKEDQERITEFIAKNSDRLLNTLAMYVRQGDLAQGSAAKQTALELLSELTIEALAHAEALTHLDQQWHGCSVLARTLLNVGRWRKQNKPDEATWRETSTG